MENQEPLDFNATATQALRLQAKLERHGVYATVRMDDDALRVSIPAYGELQYGVDQSVGTKCTNWDFENFLQELKDCLAYHENVEVARQQAVEVLAQLPPTALKALFDVGHELSDMVAGRHRATAGHVRPLVKEPRGER